ncbi:hypothetical protein PENTCL1PPCAC_20971 [Pristionchus entomophagus]|uniref:G protein-coupled receptor n=1 Tax=Pristionchus entomophagus TaxID=358040 RepID=A0AAV5TX35_9BILA|nr:hypothetical protein PENTCL1PPCAC_20971 [Pristionchus entomophagus]
MSFVHRAVRRGVQDLITCIAFTVVFEVVTLFVRNFDHLTPTPDVKGTVIVVTTTMNPWISPSSIEHPDASSHTLLIQFCIVASIGRFVINWRSISPFPSRRGSVAEQANRHVIGVLARPVRLILNRMNDDWKSVNASAFFD